MGREGSGSALTPDGAVPVSLHLDSQALDLTGGMRRSVPRVQIRDVGVDGPVVSFTTDGESFRLVLGECGGLGAGVVPGGADLVQKLGVSRSSPAYVRGELPTPLDEELAGHLVDRPADAVLVVAVVRDPAHLADLPGWLAVDAVGLPVWVIHGKGRSSAPGSNAVRTVMRSAGFRDTKITAVSGGWSATRYHPP